MKSARFWVVVLLMVGSLSLLRWRGDTDRTPPSTPLGEMPMTIGPWTATEFPLDQETLDVLGKGIFLNRSYQPAGEKDPAESAAVLAEPVTLFIGYFPTQRTGQSIHSPQNCLPGAGWVFESSGQTTLHGADGKAMPVGEYIISNGTSKAEVLYWYQTQGQSIVGDYKAKIYMLVNSIRHARTDAALVRVITLIPKGESQADAHERAVSFAQRISPMLPTYIPD